MCYKKIIKKTYLTFMNLSIIIGVTNIKTIQYLQECEGSTDKIEKENIEKLQRSKIKTLDDF